jgi:hypothetical protein
MASSAFGRDLNRMTGESIKHCLASLRSGKGGERARKRLAALVRARDEVGLPVSVEVREQADARLARLRRAEDEVAAYNRRRAAAR